jgi:hypothetical protein
MDFNPNQGLDMLDYETRVSQICYCAIFFLNAMLNFFKHLICFELVFIICFVLVYIWFIQLVLICFYKDFCHLDFFFKSKLHCYLLFRLSGLMMLLKIFLQSWYFFMFQKNFLQSLLLFSFFIYYFLNFNVF